MGNIKKHNMCCVSKLKTASKISSIFFLFFLTGLKNPCTDDSGGTCMYVCYLPCSKS